MAKLYTLNSRLFADYSKRVAVSVAQPDTIESALGSKNSNVAVVVKPSPDLSNSLYGSIFAVPA
jgi:hypothetical protein